MPNVSAARTSRDLTVFYFASYRLSRDLTGVLDLRRTGSGGIDVRRGRGASTRKGQGLGQTRWPRWVYDAGDEPDYRFSFANERTFLAWIRTALALIAGGVGLHAIQLSMSPTLQRCLAAIL